MFASNLHYDVCQIFAQDVGDPYKHTQNNREIELERFFDQKPISLICGGPSAEPPPFSGHISII